MSLYKFILNQLTREYVSDEVIRRLPEMDYSYTDDLRNNALIVACEHQMNPNVIKIMLEHGADKYIGHQGLAQQNALMNACKYQDFEVIDLLMKHGAHKYLDQSDSWGDTALMMACHYQNDPKVFELLLQHDAESQLQQTNVYKKNALMFACQSQDNPRVIEILLQHGADKYLQQIDLYDYKALTLACYNRKDLRIIKLLLEYGAGKNAKDRKQTLLIAAYHSTFEIFHFLYKHFPDSEAFLEHVQMYKVRNHQTWRFLQEQMKTRFVVWDAPLKNAYKTLGVASDASGRDIRDSYLELRKKLEKGETVLRASSSSSESKSKSSQLSMARVTEAYNLLKNSKAREVYDEVHDRPRKHILNRIKQVCFDSKKEPISFDKFKDMDLETLRRVYVVFASGKGYRMEELEGKTRKKGHCFSEETLAEMAQQGIEKWTNPLTRKPMDKGLYNRLQK